MHVKVAWATQVPAWPGLTKKVVVKLAQTNRGGSEQTGAERFIFDIIPRAHGQRAGLRTGSLAPATNRVNRQAR